MPVEVGEGTGGAFKDQVAIALGVIPTPVLETMAAKGLKIKTGTTMIEMNPELKGVQPRGWPPGTTWDGAEGMYSSNDKTVNVTESYRPAGQTGYMKSRRVRGVMLHESGHGFDHALDNASNSIAFIDAYNKDVEQGDLRFFQKVSLGYYLQEGRAGRSETFAETFAWNAGQVGADHTDIRQFFPNVSKLVKTLMDRGSWVAA